MKTKDYFNYIGKTCIITGVNSEIGKEIAQILSNLHTDLYILDKTPIRIPGAKFIEVDLTNKESIDEAFYQIPEKVDSFFAIGNANENDNGYDTFTKNFIANKYITEQYLRHRMFHGGSIVYLNSTNALYWDKYYKEFEEYINAKSWEEMTTLLKNKINENIPSIQTSILSERALTYFMTKSTIELRQQNIRINSILAKKEITTSEIVETLIYLNSNMARAISGVPLLLDNGYTTSIKIGTKKDELDKKAINKMDIIQNKFNK